MKFKLEKEIKILKSSKLLAIPANKEDRDIFLRPSRPLDARQLVRDDYLVTKIFWFRFFSQGQNIDLSEIIETRIGPERRQHN